MLRLIWIFGIVLALASCGDKVSEANSEITLEKPTDLIPEDKMIQVLADVHLLEGAVGFNVPRPPSMIPDVNDPAMIRQIPAVSQQQSIPYYDIFKKHACTRDQFERSLQWYSMDPAQFTLMYDEVINELTRRQAKEQGSPAPQPVNAPK